MSRINRIIHLLESKSGHVGFRYTDCRNGKTVEGRITGGKSNVTAALCKSDVGEWLCDYYTIASFRAEREILALPYAGCEPHQIRDFVKKGIGRKGAW